MIQNVILNLNVFQLYYFVQILFFALTFSIVAKHDYNEYRMIGPFFGNCMYCMRLSFGQIRTTVFAEDQMSPEDKVLFWFIFVAINVFSGLIFLTFVIARVTDSYDTVNEYIEAIKLREKCTMINLAEKVMPEFMKKNKNNFPDYIVSREREP
jgi:hypothetical protein